LDFVAGGGEMGELIRKKDWSGSALGSPATWSQSLRILTATILENPFPMYIIWGPEYLQVYNDSFRTILGSTKHPEALGISSAITFSEVWPIIHPMFEQVRSGKAVSFTDFMVPLNRHGYIEHCYFDFSYSPIRNEMGIIEGILVTAIETTEKKKNQERLMESELRIRSLIDNAPFPIAVYTGNNMLIELANQTMMEVWGKGFNVIGKSYREILPELGDQGIFKQLEEVMATGKALHKKNQQINLVINGKTRSFYFNYSFTPLQNSSGIVNGVMNTAADVTDLNLAKIQIQKSEENLRNTILKAPVAMCILRGPTHIVELGNELMFAIWGRKENEVLNKPVFEGLPEAKDQGFEEILDGVYLRGDSFTATDIPVNLPRDQGIENVYINILCEPYREADGNVPGIVVVAVDVTPQVIARRRIEEVVADRTRKLAEANSNLEKSNADLAQFAYIASHDLQEPIRKISTFTNLLETNLKDSLDNTSKTYFNKIKNSALRMQALIRDVLQYSEVSRDFEHFVTTDLNEILASVLSDYELLLEQKGSEINICTLPVIQAIPLQMTQLFGNILGNALKFTRTESQSIITITSSKASENEIMALALDPAIHYFKIQITDNGIGIKKEYTDQIFNIFQRLHDRSAFEGTGIGLALCKKIVLNHKGNIHANQSSEQGAVISILLPGEIHN
jgi:signal transduction histidine kinase